MTTNDHDWLEGREPPTGWDNWRDIAEAKRLCRDMRHAFVASSAGMNSLFDFAQRLRAQAISRSMALELIWTHCAPPPDLSKERMAEEIERAYDDADWTPGACSLVKLRDEGAAVDSSDAWPCLIDYNPKLYNAQLAEEFLAARPGQLISSDGVLFTLDEGRTWREISETELASEIRKTDPTIKLDTRRLQAMVQALHVERFTKARPFEWIDPPDDAPAPHDLILFANGIFDFGSGKLLPHSGRYFATGLPEFDFDPEAMCPIWDRCVGEWLDASFHDTLGEFMGYALAPDTRYEKMLALYGARRGGKSTVLRVLSWLVGPSHVISRNPNDLGSDFGLEGALDAKLLLIPDAHDGDVSRRGAVLDRLKSISGQDEVSVNRKGQKIITARVPTRIVIAANRPPKFLDDSGALASRQLVLVFERTFEGKEDRDLSSKLRAELPGIANRALAGLHRLRENGGRFTVGTKGLAAARDLAESHAPALRFAKTCLIVTGDPTDYVPLATVFEAYEEWATDESLGARERRNRNDFKDDLIAALMTRGVRYDRRRWHDPARPKIGRGKLVRGLFGVRVKQ